MAEGRASALALVACPALASSLLVLRMAAVDRRLWLIHLSAIGLAGVIAAVGHRALRRPGAAIAILALTMVGLAAPFLGGGAGPHRWAPIGPLRVYLAPVLLPSFIAAWAVVTARRRSTDRIAAAAAIGVSLLLAAQPDASQALALLAGLAVVGVRFRLDPLRSGVTLAAIGLITGWAFTRPDPLEPVPYVEGVFALALAHALPAGLAVIASAVALIAGLAISSRRGPAWLSAVAAYYAVLFACSVAGLTPAPLISYGAGPALGYGLMVAVSRSPIGAESRDACNQPGDASPWPSS